MPKLIRACICTFILLFAFTLQAQETSSVVFSFDKTRVNDREVLLNIKAKIEPHIKLYALQTSEADPLFSTISFDSVFP